MGNPQPIEEKVTLYMLGELPEAEAREFETKLASSPDLQNVVRELEESVIAISASAPTHLAPQFVLTQVEDAIEAENRSSKILPIFSRLVRNGWAAAAACLAGWIIYAFSIERPAPSPQKVIVEKVVSSGRENVATIRTNLVAVEAAAAGRETIILSNQVVGLQRQVLQLSQSVTQQQAMLNDASRIKFHQFAPADGAQTLRGRSLSPALQRALFLAMARELGWIPSTNEVASPKVDEALNVQFVDLRPEKEKSDSPRQEAEKKSETQATEFASATTQAPVAAVIPGFVAGDDVVVALDNTVAPTGSQVSVLTGRGAILGNLTIGDNAVVLTVPNNVPGGLQFQFVSPNGQMNVIDLNLTGPQ